MERQRPHRTLPGSRFAVGGRREWLRTLVGIACFLGPALWALRLAARLRARRLQHCLERWWARGVITYLGIRLDVEGVEHIDPGERYVVASLHEGFADGLALALLPLDLRFSARDELFEWRALGGYLRDSGQVLLDTRQPVRGYRELLRRAGAIFAEGESLVLFPQGSILGIEIAFQQGAFRLAERTGRPLLPVVLTGSHRIWEHPFTPRLRYGQRLSMKVLPPIPSEHVRARAAALEAEMKAQALSGVMAPPRRFDPERDGYWDGYGYEVDRAFPELAAKVARHRRSSAAPRSRQGGGG